MKTIGVIPARFASSRFPGKPLAKIGGRSMLSHVWEKASSCRELDEVLIACDHEDIYNEAKNLKARVVMTDPRHPSGSDRIAEAIKDINVDIVLNIQGDEPFVNPGTIDALAVLLKRNPDTQMGTVIKEITNTTDAQNPNVVKCVVDKQGNALYFSRVCIPYLRADVLTDFKRYKHLGLYAYRKEFLMKFKDWPKSALEAVEMLEQLRALENGVKIKTTVTDFESIAVDTPSDLQKAQEWYEKLKLMTK